MEENKILKHKYSMRYNDIKRTYDSIEEDKLNGDYSITDLEGTNVQEQKDNLAIEKTKLLHEGFHQAYSNENKIPTDSESMLEMLKLNENIKKELRNDETHNEVRKSEVEIQVSKPREEGKDEKDCIEKEELSLDKVEVACSEEAKPDSNPVISDSNIEVDTNKNASDSVDKPEGEDVASQRVEKEATQKDSMIPAGMMQGLSINEVAKQSDEAITQVKIESAEANFNKEEVSMTKDDEMDKVSSGKETKSKNNSEKRKKVSMKGDDKKYIKEDTVKPDTKEKQSKSIIKKYRTNKQSAKADKAKLKAKVSVTVSEDIPSSMDEANGIGNEVIESEETRINGTKDSVVVQNEQAVEDDKLELEKKVEEKAKEDSIIDNKTITEPEEKEKLITQKDEPVQPEIVIVPPEDMYPGLKSVEIKRESPTDDFGFHLYGKRSLSGHFVSRVEPGTISDRAGLRVGDRLVMVGGQNVEKMKHIQVVELIKNTTGNISVSVTNEMDKLQEARGSKEKAKPTFSTMDEARPKPKKRGNQGKSWKERKALFKNL